MWQNLLRHCVVFTKASEEFTPYYLAEIRHDMRQTTHGRGVRSGTGGTNEGWGAARLADLAVV